VRALVFHPNGKYLLSAADDHTIRIWELKTGRCIRKIEAHERFVSSISWGRQTISSDVNGKAGSSSGPLLMNVIASASSDQVRGIFHAFWCIYQSPPADVEDMDAVMARADECSGSRGPSS
jgi:platelet-activating factor acetylhydrolase IB subunit alpha